MGRTKILFLLAAAILAIIAMAGCSRLAIASFPSSQAKGKRLLVTLGNCGPADGPRCAQVHLSLARHYLDIKPLTRTAIDNAARELAMAAQDPGMAVQIRPWRRLTRSWKRQDLALKTCRNRQARTATRIANLQEQNLRISGRLHRLESLLQQEAQKTVTRQH